MNVDWKKSNKLPAYTREEEIYGKIMFIWRNGWGRRFQKVEMAWYCIRASIKVCELV